MAVNLKKWRPHQSILVVIGGHGQRQLRHIKKIYPHVTYVLVIDAAKEIDALTGVPRSPVIKLFHLGHGHTALTLSKKLPKRLLEKMRSLGGMAASEGMGQSILVGRLAAQELVASPDFNDFFKQVLLPAIRAQAGGAIEEIQFLFLGSAAGGTYSGAEIPVANALAELVTKFTSAIAHVVFLVTGPLTYEGLGDRILKNGSSALAELTAYVTASDRKVRHVRSLRLLELSLCGIDEQLRDGFLAQIEQAAHSKWMKYNLQRTAPNRAQNGRFGNIHIWEAAFGTPLVDREHIAPVIADAYLPVLRAVRDRVPADSLVERLEIDHARTPIASRTVEEILEDAADLPTDALLRELEACSFLDAVAVLAHRSGSVRDSLTTIQQSWAPPANSLESLDERMQQQRRLSILFRGELQLLAEREATLRIAVDETRDHFARQHALLQAEGLWNFFRGALSSTAKKLAHLSRSAFALRSAAEELVEVRTERSALERHLALIEADFNYCHGKLVRLISRLENSGPALGAQLPCVTASPLAERLPELWSAVDESLQFFMDAVRGSAHYVTLSGLARITGATAPRIEEIAAQIATGAYCETPAIAWGGQRRAGQGEVFFVFPPVDVSLASLLTDELKVVAPGLAVAFADAAPAVINVTSITMRQVRRLSNILTKPYRHSLHEVATGPFLESFLPEGLSTLKALGVTVGERRLKFKHG